MAGSWGCPHEVNDTCTRVKNLTCSPGRKGCVLFGRFIFANEEKNTRLGEKQAHENTGNSAAANGGNKS
jgi:hypothetical protein